MRYFLLMSLSSMLLGGCLIKRTQVMAQNYQYRLNQTLGMSAVDLVRQIGYPDRTFDSPTKNTVYAYERATQGRNPTFQMPGQNIDNSFAYNKGRNVMGNTITVPGATLGGNTYVSYCNTYFEIDSSERVVYFSFQGNSCH